MVVESTTWLNWYIVIIKLYLMVVDSTFWVQKSHTLVACGLSCFLYGNIRILR